MLSSRDAYKHELTKLAYKYEDIIAVEADLGGKKHIFKQHHPSRFLISASPKWLPLIYAAA
ncbi:hypothetical protein [Staphylococcus aureus]|nr:hypothetical protein [Staphylococcus aureus]